MISRGTNPPLTFTIPESAFCADDIEILHIAFCQNRQLVLEKRLEDCILAGQTITVPLSETETLRLNDRAELEMQIRAKLKDGQKKASRIMRTEVGRILKDGELND